MRSRAITQTIRGRDSRSDAGGDRRTPKLTSHFVLLGFVFAPWASDQARSGKKSGGPLAFLYARASRSSSRRRNVRVADTFGRGGVV